MTLEQGCTGCNDSGTAGGSREPSVDQASGGFGRSEKEAWERLILLGQLPADALYSPSQAKQGAYVRARGCWIGTAEQERRMC